MPLIVNGRVNWGWDDSKNSRTIWGGFDVTKEKLSIECIFVSKEVWG